MMNKFKRIVCCLVMPILAVVGLAGCGNDRDALTIENRYAQMIQDHGDMFATLEDGTKSYKVSVSYSVDEMQKLKNLNGLYSEFSADENLYARYYALKNLQAEVLDNVFEYYVQQKTNFFLNFDAQEMEKDERKQLYNNIEKLEEDIETFKVARDKFEKSVDVLTFKGIVKADITAFAYDYNMLIERCIEFVRYFKDLNTKYFYSGTIDDVNYQSYIKQYLDEAVFEINELYYYNYLKSFNSVAECDLAKIYQDPTSATLTLKNLGGDWGYVLFNEDGTGLKTLVANFDVNKYIYSRITLDNIATFQQEREMFMQKFRVYKSVYENMDYYKYNQALVEGTDADYLKECTNVEKANITLIKGFYGEVTTYINAMTALIG